MMWMLVAVALALVAVAYSVWPFRSGPRMPLGFEAEPTTEDLRRLVELEAHAALSWSMAAGEISPGSPTDGGGRGSQGGDR